MTTRTLTIEIENSHALRLVEELAELKLIRIRKDKEHKVVRKKKLPEEVIGSITSEEADELHRQLNEMRDKNQISTYEQHHEPMTVEEFVESIKVAERQIESGDCDSLDDFENSSKQWD